MEAVAIPDYLELLRDFVPRPICNDADYQRTVAYLDKFLDSRTFTEAERDFRALLGVLIHAYESASFPLPTSTGVERLRFLMEQNDINQTTLAAETGIPIQSLSDILNERRGISAKLRAVLGKRFNVPSYLFA